VDAALVDWPDGPDVRGFRLLSFVERPWPADLQARIHRLAASRVPGGEALAELAELDVLLGGHFADAAREAALAAGLGLEAVEAIASHGQTVAHHPERHATLQIGDPSVIAERTGCTTVADFRARDVAAGGEGAPLAPFFHRAVFAHETEARLVLNLGGMANVTWLPPGAPEHAVRAFDVGPANALIDGVVAVASAGERRMDEGGALAAAGQVDPALLERLLDDPFLRRPPPKSTGRERYGMAEAERLVEEWNRAGRELADLVATLVAFSADAVAHAVRDFLEPPSVVLAGGGGVRNPALMRALARRFPDAELRTFDDAGVPAAAAEAMAFSLMGRNALLGLSNHLPATTGARHATVLGEIVPAGPR
jgi:anhydro-N-acetylmuramic acid kinase